MCSWKILCMLSVVFVLEEAEAVATETEEAGVASSFCSSNLDLFAGVANSSVKLEIEQALLGETP